MYSSYATFRGRLLLKLSNSRLAKFKIFFRFIELRLHSFWILWSELFQFKSEKEWTCWWCSSSAGRCLVAAASACTRSSSFRFALFWEWALFRAAFVWAPQSRTRALPIEFNLIILIWSILRIERKYFFLA